MEEKTELSIGKYLQGIREEQQLSIKEIAKRTCMHEKFLQMIEADNFDEMGGVGYAKAMLISYARALGANDKLVLQRFNSKYVPVKPQLHRFQHQKQHKILIPTSSIYLLLLVILMVILTIFIVNLSKNGQLNFSLRKHLQGNNAQKVNILDKPVNRTKSLYDSLEEENQQKLEDKKDESGKQAVKIDLDALQDTTDYTDKYLFKGEDSPYNVKE
ncbi:MAG: helix-turn-helix domain-containing protein [Candidatus Cloacimonetes bacterium]|nr:helix-turn-helix domain-containing protein [Candidatus Cloacimonadota bacterium]